MKNPKFKVGDKVTPTIKEDKYYGKKGIIINLEDFEGDIVVDFDNGIGYYKDFGLIKFNPSLTITIKPSTRKGVKSFRWEFKHANGRKSNHSYNTKSSAKKELTKFINSIKNEDYEIVIK